MKSVKRYIAGVLFACVLFSCNEKDGKGVEVEYLNSFINKLQVSDMTNWIVILPGLGCQGCIQEAELFMKENISNKNILFILNRIESVKILEQKTGVRLSNKPNVYIDKQHKLNIPTDNNIYPCIIQIERGKVRRHEFQSPKNSQAFNNLKARIESKHSE